MDATKEILLMEQRLTNMEEKLSEVEDKIDTIDKKLNQVVEALVGNDIASTKGIVGEVKYIKSKVEEHDEIVKKIKYGWIVIAFVATVLAFISKSIIEHFLTKNFK